MFSVETFCGVFKSNVGLKWVSLVVLLIGLMRHLHVMRCAIWYHFYNSRNVKSTNGGVLLLASACEDCNSTENNTHPWVFSRFLNCTMYKWYQIAQSVTHNMPHLFLLKFNAKILS